MQVNHALVASFQHGKFKAIRENKILVKIPELTVRQLNSSILFSQRGIIAIN